MDDDVLMIILEANGMNLPRTIEALLDMQPAAAAAAEDTDKISLPEDFLRPPSYFRKTLSHQTSRQIAEDAMLARLIQDEVFMQDLANNPNMLDSNQPSQVTSPQSQRRNSDSSIREKISILGKCKNSTTSTRSDAQDYRMQLLGAN